MTRGSRRIEPYRVASQGFEAMGIPDAAKRDDIDWAAKDFREILAEPHVGAEEVGRVVGEVDEHIDVAASRVEVVARSRSNQLEERDAAARARSADAVEVVGNKFDHAESLPCRQAGRQ